MKVLDGIAVETTAQETTSTIYGSVGTDIHGQPIVLSHKPGIQHFNENVVVFGNDHREITSCYSINYILQAIRRKESIIVTENTDECYDATAAYAKEQGYTVRRLNLRDFANSDSWDLLNTCLSVEDIFMSAMSLSRAFLESDPTKGKEYDIYSQGAQEVLTTLLMRVYLGSDFGDTAASYKISDIPTDINILGNEYLGEKTLASIYEILCHPDGYHFYRAITAYDVLKRTSSTRADSPLSDASPGFVSNILANLRMRLRFLNNEDLLRIVSTEGIDLRLPGKEPCLYFCDLAPDIGTYNTIANLFIAMLIKELNWLARWNKNHVLEVPVNFLLDDIQALGHFADWSRVLNQSCNSGIKVSMIAPDPVILEEVCGSHIRYVIDTMINYGSSGSVLFDDLASYKSLPLVDMSAKYPEEKEDNVRLLINRKDLHYMNSDNIIVSFSRHSRIALKKFPYTSHPDFEKLHK